MSTLINIIQDEDGAAAVEYTMLLSFIALAVIGAVSILGTNMNSRLTTFNNTFPK